MFDRLSRSASSNARFTPRPKSTGAAVHFKRPLPTPVSVNNLCLRKSSSAFVRETTQVSDDSKAFKTRLSAWESPQIFTGNGLGDLDDTFRDSLECFLYIFIYLSSKPQKMLTKVNEDFVGTFLQHSLTLERNSDLLNISSFSTKHF